jgi:putative NADH-flavin reductase
MKITVFGATGMVGKRVVEQALATGYFVNAFGRNVQALIDKDHRDDHLTAIKGYVFDESDVEKAIKGADAVVSVLGGAADGTDKSRSLGMKNIIQQMEKTGVKRIIAVGGMGVLNADAEHYILDTPAYPQQYKTVGQEHLLAYLYLQASSLEWTFVCPPNIFDEDGKGQWITNADYLPDPNFDEIAAGDLAGFMLAEINGRSYLRHRVGISRK